MNNKEKLYILQDEVESLLQNLNNVENELWQNGEVLNEYKKIALLGELQNYFNNQFEAIENLLIENKEDEAIFLKVGNKYLLENSSELLMQNLLEFYMTEEQLEFQFTEDFLETLILQL